MFTIKLTFFYHLGEFSRHSPTLDNSFNKKITFTSIISINLRIYLHIINALCLLKFTLFS